MKFDNKLYLCLLAAMTLAACGNDSNSGNEPECDPECSETQYCNPETNKCEDIPVAVECTKDIDCKGNLICVKNHCVEDEQNKPECTENKDCSGSLICKDEKCVPECMNSDECTDGKICKANQCVLECASNDECSEEMPVCRNNHCRPICDEDEDCEAGVCLSNACVECKTANDCTDSKQCSDDHLCVECTEDTDCNGNLFCENNTCKAECESSDDCSGEKPHCVENLCRECENDDQCDGTNICKENTCQPECTADFDCTNNGKCSDKQTCVECLDNDHCGEHKICVENACQDGIINDIDSDGTADENDVCPYNPRYTTQTDVDCNLVIESDGSKVFEIYHATDFNALRKYLNPDPNATPTCNETEEGETPAVGDCCTQEYEESCQNDKHLSCVNGVITETACEKGCGETACLLCTTTAEGAEPAAGDCCTQDMNITCENDHMTACIDGIVSEVTCKFGCGENSCNFCKTPEDHELAVGDCCDPTVFEAHCSDDSTQQITCDEGIVTATTCTDKCSDESVAFACLVVPAPELTIRLMKDINLMDALAEEDVKSVTFDPIKTVWKENKTNEETGENEVITHNDETTPFVIDDAECVAKWDSISLENMEFDGKKHSIIFKNDEDKSCSLVNPIFDSIKNSSVHDLTLDYNVRGLISSIFANTVSDSKIASIGVKGNIHLESAPAMEEAVDYLKDGNIVPQKYQSNIFAVNSSKSIWSDIQFLGNVTQTTSNPFSTDSSFAGFSGLFRESNRDFIANASIEIADYLLSYRRDFALFGSNMVSSQIDNPSVKAGFIAVSSDDSKLNSSTSFALASASTYPNGIKIKTGDVYLPTNIRYYAAGSFDNKTNVIGNIEYESGNIFKSKEDNLDGATYAVFDTLSGTINGDINAKSADVMVGSYYGLATKFAPQKQKGNITLNIGNISLSDTYCGLALQYEPEDDTTKNEENTTNITIQDVAFINPNASNKIYYGFTKDFSSVVKNLKIKAGNMSMNGAKYYGLSHEMSNPSSPAENNDTVVSADNVTIEIGDISDASYVRGVAETIRGSVSIDQISLKMGNITQKTSPSDLFDYGYFSGFATELLGGFSNAKLNIASIHSNEHIGLMAKTCQGEINNIEIIVGDITSEGQGSEIKKAGFDGVCSDLLLNVENISMDIGNIYISNASEGNIITSKCQGELKNARIKVKSLITDSDATAIKDFYNDGPGYICSMENIAVQIDHLQGEKGAYAIDKIYKGTSIKDFAFYADMYSKSTLSGFINTQVDEGATLERILTASRLNTYSNVDETTHKPTDAVVSHENYHFINKVNVEEALDRGDKVKMDTKVLYWLKRDGADKAAAKNYIIDNDLTAQFRSIDPSSAEFALSTQDAPGVDPEITLSGCNEINTSCKTNWSKTLLSITEPNGSKINIPWLKNLSELNP